MASNRNGIAHKNPNLHVVVNQAKEEVIGSTKISVMNSSGKMQSKDLEVLIEEFNSHFEIVIKYLIEYTN